MSTKDMKNIIAINGAYGGIGSVITHRLVELGNSVVLMGRDENKLRALYNSLCSTVKNDCQVKFYLLDMSDIGSILNAANEIFSDFGRVDILVNAAGPIPPVGGIFDVTDEQWLEAAQVTLIGTIRLVKAFSEKMINQKMGKIILINGVLSIQPDPLFVISSTMTAAINNFTKAVSKDLGKYGIRVNAINPGVTQTPLLNEVMKHISEKFNISVNDISKQMIETTPLGRIATATDIADSVEFLCSEKSNFLNGAFVTIDGGSSTAY